jgi:hypothetical protein
MLQLSRAEFFAVCYTCRHRHPCYRIDEFRDFENNHKGHAVSFLNREALHERRLDRMAAYDPRKIVKSAFGAAAAWALRQAYGERWDVLAFQGNANVKEAFQGASTLTVTSLHSLARSVTAGWQSASIDNTSNLYLDDLFEVLIAAVNTAAGNGKVFYVFAGHSNDGGTTWTGTGNGQFTGSQGTCTYAAVDANAIPAPILGTIPYITTNVAIASRAMSMAATCNGVLPPGYVVGVVNDSGFTTAASGNTVKSNGVYATVV